MARQPKIGHRVCSHSQVSKVTILVINLCVGSEYTQWHNIFLCVPRLLIFVRHNWVSSQPAYMENLLSQHFCNSHTSKILSPYISSCSATCPKSTSSSSTDKALGFCRSSLKGIGTHSHKKAIKSQFLMKYSSGFS